MPSRDINDACSYLREAIPRVLETYNSYFDRYGLVARVGEVLRTTQEQQAKYAQGRTTPGEIVTRVDGVTKLSNHQAQLAHGETCSHAVDIDVFRTADRSYVGREKGDERWYLAFGGLALANGLQSGVLWLHPDRPHIYCIAVEA